MKSVIAIILLLAVVRTEPVGRATGNDTDAVIARGLFPLGAPSSSLKILRETVRVSLDRDRVTTNRVYLIRNDGAASAVRLATACGGRHPLAGECGAVLIQGASPSWHRAIGYLVDSGTHVSIKPKTRREIEECLKTVDGTVCGHEWMEFAIDLGAGETLQVSLKYQAPFNDRYWIESVVGQLYLYTEKFWAGDAVPQVAVWMELKGGQFALQSWTPRGLYAQYSIPPSRAVDGAILWQLDGYRPVKKPYTYLFSLLHPWSVDGAQIRSAYQKATSSPGSVHR